MYFLCNQSCRFSYFASVALQTKGLTSSLKTDKLCVADDLAKCNNKQKISGLLDRNFLFQIIFFSSWLDVNHKKLRVYKKLLISKLLKKTFTGLSSLLIAKVSFSRVFV